MVAVHIAILRPLPTIQHFRLLVVLSLPQVQLRLNLSAKSARRHGHEQYFWQYSVPDQFLLYLGF